MQKPESFQSWHDQAPDGFRFAIKGPQYITHRRRLKDVATPLANFFASGLLCMQAKLGPILWQLPPNLPHVDDRVIEFAKLLPQTSRAAADLAARHDHFVEGRAHLDPGGDYPVRHVFEFRHSSFRDADLMAELRRYGIAVVIADAGEHALGTFDATADFVYLRMHGQDPAYTETGYTDAALARTAGWIRDWAAGGQPAGLPVLLPPAARATGRDVFVYFDNDEKGHAPKDAIRLAKLLGI